MGFSFWENRDEMVKITASIPNVRARKKVKFSYGFIRRRKRTFVCNIMLDGNKKIPADNKQFYQLAYLKETEPMSCVPIFSPDERFSYGLWWFFDVSFIFYL